MADDKVQAIEISDFRQGANTEDKAHEISPLHSPDLQNVDLSSKGSVKTRDGKAQLNTVEITSATGIFGAFYGRSLHLVAALTDVYKLVTTTYTSIKGSLTSNSPTYFADWNAYTYGANGVEAPWKYDGTNAPSAITTPPTAWSTTKPNQFCYHENRMWAITFSTSKLDWSNLDTGDVWTGVDDAGYHLFAVSDGFTGTGIVSQKGGIVFFKQNSIHKVLGKTTVSFSFKCLYPDVGSIAPRSIVNINNRIFFLSKYGGDNVVFVLDDTGGLTLMSNNITPTLNTMTSGSESLAAAGTYKNKYILSFPISGGWKTVNLNYVQGSWEIDSGNSARCYYSQGANLYGGSTTGGYVYQIGTGTADDTAAITSYVWSKNYTMEAPNNTKRLLYLMVWAKASGSWNMDINIKVDDKLYPQTWKMPLGTKGSLETTRREIVPLNCDVQGGMVAVKFGTSTINQPFEIYKATLFYEIGSPIQN